MSAGYLVLVFAFLVMVGSCFAFALSELRRPRDPGPLPIDVSRDIAHRYFARLLRRRPAPAGDIVPGEPSRVRRYAPRELPDGSEVASAREAFVVHGDGRVAAGGRVDAFVCEGIATIGAAATVLEHADGAEELVLDVGASVGGRATSARRIVLAPGTRVGFAAAPVIRTSGAPAPDAVAPLVAWDESFDADLEWLLSVGTPMDRAIRDLVAGAGIALNAVNGLRRAEHSILRATEPIPLRGGFAPSWIGAAEAWYLGAGTIRVRGDLILPPGAIVPTHLIVEGSIAAGRGVTLHGSVHAWGDVSLGDHALAEGSITARGAVAIGNGSTVGGCVSAGSDASVGAGCVVGRERNGGLAAGGTATIGAGTIILTKLYAEHGAMVRPLGDAHRGERAAVRAR